MLRQSPCPTDKTLVTVATYNEMENLPRLVEEILRYAPEVDILVIDDNSPDGTGQWCDQQRAEDPRMPAFIARASWAWAPPRSPA